MISTHIISPDIVSLGNLVSPFAGYHLSRCWGHIAHRDMHPPQRIDAGNVSSCWEDTVFFQHSSPCLCPARKTKDMTPHPKEHSSRRRHCLDRRLTLFRRRGGGHHVSAGDTPQETISTRGTHRPLTGQAPSERRIGPKKNLGDVVPFTGKGCILSTQRRKKKAFHPRGKHYNRHRLSAGAPSSSCKGRHPSRPPRASTAKGSPRRNVDIAPLKGRTDAKA
jgi:hypothetical protein